MKKKIYRAREGSRIKDHDAEIIGSTVEKLSKSGGVTASRFVEMSKNKEAPTHYLFDWDDKRMANLHREHQARVYMASVTIKIKQVETRAFIPEPVRYEFKEEDVDQQRDKQKSYLPIETILKNKNETESLLSKCKAEAMSWMKRWKQYVHLSDEFNSMQPIFKAIENLDENIS